MSAELKPYSPKKPVEVTAPRTPISVEVLYKNGKEDTLDVHDKIQTATGWEFVKECADGRITVFHVYVSEVARLSINQTAMAYFRDKQTPAVAAQPSHPVPPYQPPVAPVTERPSYVPSPLESLNRPLRSAVRPDGTPVSELPNGQVVPAGFFSSDMGV